MDDATEPLLHTCQSCGTLIDIEDQEPLTLVHCPSCGTGQRVRTKFDHFEIQDVLGAGGMGAVYRAWDTTLSRAVALKLLRKEFSTDPEFVAQFQREAAITASINHPNVVRVYSSGNDHELLYIAMELVDKGSLDDLMTLQGRVAEAQVLEVGVQIARGLNAALQRGLIHRDVKPGNILFADAHTSKIVDFGLASLQEQAGKTGGEVWGTPYYVAPEKLDNPPQEDFRSDLYSLGATLFHALSGRPPFEAETASMVALKHLKSQAVSLQAFAPDVSSATAFAINKALNKDPDQRYGSYEEFIQHLEYARAELLKKGPGGQKRARVTMENEDDARAMSWITFGMVAIVVLGGVSAWVFRDRLFTKTDLQAPPKVQAQRKVQAHQEERFKATRGVLLAGNAQKAATGFRAFADEMDVPQPLLNWLTLHEGLAQLVANNEKASRLAFTKLSTRELYGRTPEEKAQAQFFVDLGKRLSTAKTVPSGVAKDFNKSNHEAIALLIFGLKDWALADYEEASRLLRQFESSTPEPPVEWIAEYKALITPYIEQGTIYRGVAEAIKEKDLGKAKAALPALKEAKEKLTMTALKQNVEEAIARIEKSAADSAEKEKEDLAEAEKADETKLAEAKKNCSALIAQLRFAEGLAVAQAAKPTTSKGKKPHDLLVKRMEALANFKADLVRELSTKGYAGPATRRTGAPLPPGTLMGNETQLQIKSPYGATPIGWLDISLDSFLAIGKSLIKPTLPKEEAAEKQWNLGNYALVIGKADIARELLAAAAEGNPEYKEAVDQLVPPVAKDAEKDKEKKPEEKK